MDVFVRTFRAWQVGPLPRMRKTAANESATTASGEEGVAA